MNYILLPIVLSLVSLFTHWSCTRSLIIHWLYYDEMTGMRIKSLQSLSVTKVTIWMGLAQFEGFLTKLLRYNNIQQ